MNRPVQQEDFDRCLDWPAIRVMCCASPSALRRVLSLVASLSHRIAAIVAFATLLLFNSCVTIPEDLVDDSIRPDLPAEASFNEAAGCGDLLYLTLRLDSGKELLFALDTGAPVTLLDKSLEPQLGKRLGAAVVSFPVFGPKKGHVYAAPRLYLGNTQLLTGSWVVTDDLARIRFPNREARGILGMDCLRHYCLQLDFPARKIRFLDPDLAARTPLGKAFPLTFSSGLVTVFVGENLLGIKDINSAIDTGDNVDGGLDSKLFLSALQDQRGVRTNHFNNPAGTASPEAYFPEVVFGGESYGDVRLWENFGGNTIGLRFLARHLVTFNFPKRTMYLRRSRS